ncbi:MAG: Stp1/IreP family PP2C-type Ser/Thr phosphatase [Chloroflexota bacterium]|nr:Stp1/IreP family PP2C-type Ser/Thr phosphatase [Ardenticatenaceae bacterium]
MSKLAPIVASMRTDIGQYHDHNEDFVSCWEPTTVEDEAKYGWLYIVADGVGGADAGEIASQFASERMLEHYLAGTDEPDWGERLRKAMVKANTELRQLVANEHESRRMATTMVTAVIHDQHATIANVGDSRAYHWRAGHIQQISKDHSLVAKLVEEGAISAAEAEDHPYGNIILYSIGSDRNPKIDVFEVPLVLGDAILLCSDGLIKHVSDQEISDFIARQAPHVATESLITLANERGGKDNISVIVLRYGKRPSELETAVSSESVVIPQSGKAVVTLSDASRLSLWLFTIFLSVAQSILIFLVWILLRV